jgi:4-hydroxythreonine-4-phosphate dehydrogenase
MSPLHSPASCLPDIRPQLAIALGDPAGIGTEVALKALRHLASLSADVTVIGDRNQLEQTYDLLCQKIPAHELAHPKDLSLIDVPLEPAIAAQIQMGIGNAASGEASFRYLETAIAHTLAGKFHAIVTAPIAKSAWLAAGHKYPGQTELLAEKAGCDRFGMLFVARSPHTGWTLRTLLATTHIPLQDVPTMLTPDLMTRKLALLIDCLRQDFGLEQPQIAIAGLNPHSGEQGQLGREEQDWMNDWLTEMGDRFPQAKLTGLLPPDTLWVKPGQAWFGTGRGEDKTAIAADDAYLALYHDQGLIPVKLMAFDRAVNTTIGLPFIRTSPDHGTAFDIAGQGVADAASFSAAIAFAVELAQQKIKPVVTA